MSTPSSPGPSAAPVSSSPTPPSAPSSSPGPDVQGGPISGSAPNAAASKPPSTPAEQERRKYKLKVDGAEQEFEWGEAEVTTRLQKALAAEKRMQEAAELRKQFQQFKQQFEQDPFEAAKLLNPDMDLDALAEQRILQKYQESQLPEHERAQREFERQKQQYETQIAELKRAEQMRYQQEMETKVQKQIEEQFGQALEAGNLPRNRYTMAMMAEVARLNLDHGLELSPQQLAAEVQERMSGINRHVVTSLKGEQLAKYLGDDVVREILKYSVAKVKPGQTQATPAPTPASSKDEDVFASTSRLGTNQRNSALPYNELKRKLLGD